MHQFDPRPSACPEVRAGGGRKLGIGTVGILTPTGWPTLEPSPLKPDTLKAAESAGWGPERGRGGWGKWKDEHKRGRTRGEGGWPVASALSYCSRPGAPSSLMPPITHAIAPHHSCYCPPSLMLLPPIILASAPHHICYCPPYCPMLPDTHAYCSPCHMLLPPLSYATTAPCPCPPSHATALMPPLKLPTAPAQLPPHMPACTPPRPPPICLTAYHSYPHATTSPTPILIRLTAYHSCPQV